VLLGSQATILIIPKLTINGRSAALDLLKNVLVFVDTVDFIDEIPTQQQFQNLNLSDNGDLTVSFTIPANLQKVSVSFSC
jgi:hypothetical protein